MITCIYHGNCADGFTAAWVVRKALGADVIFHAGRYGDAPPEVTGHDVYIVDFSYKRDVLIELAEKANKIVVLDHHKTAQTDLADLGLDNVYVVFDMEHSGARIAWRYFFPEQVTPRLIKHVEDRDLWKFELDGTREIQAALFSYPYDFAVWDRLMGDAAVDQLYQDGIAIERKHHKDVAELVKAFRRRMVIGGHDVPVANLPYTLTSDAGHLMAQGEPFAACYWDTEKGREFSLRSRDDGADVSEIALQYGGGGHKHAAGFRVPHSHPLAGGGTQVPKGWALVPERMHVTPAQLNALQFVSGYDGDGREEPLWLDTTLWVGEIQNDDGVSSYGLHANCDECPEEGSTTLAEFTAPPASEVVS